MTYIFLHIYKIKIKFINKSSYFSSNSLKFPIPKDDFIFIIIIFLKKSNYQLNKKQDHMHADELTLFIIQDN